MGKMREQERKNEIIMNIRKDSLDKVRKKDNVGRVFFLNQIWRIWK